MKILIFLVLTFCVFENFGALFELDLSEGWESQFESFQSSSYAKVSDDTDGTTTFSEDKVIKFDAVSRYAGIITKDWIVSPVIKKYTIKIDFRGREGKNTGGFLGYMTKENENIIKALALDNGQMMDYYQQLQFESQDGWKTYTFHLPESEGGIKLVLEKASYNGPTDNLEMAFKGLKVTDLELGTDCPGTPEDKIMKSYYFGTLFEQNNFEGRVNPNCIDHGETVEVQFRFPFFDVPCIKTSMYALDKNENVIEAFAPDFYLQNGIINESYFSQKITLSQLNDYGCTETETDFSASKGTQCTTYVCQTKLYFWLDYGESYSTQQEEYDYVKSNSYSVFSSQFTVQVNKETSTFLNTLVQTLVKEGVCPGDCILDLSLSLDLKVKYGDEDYKTQLSAMTVTWGDQLDFQIQSTPADYTLTLNTIFVQTGEQTGEEYTKLSEIFIDSFVENQKSSATGQLTFSMKVSGESGLSKGKPFNLKFLVKSEATGRMLEATYASSDLPTAAITDSSVKFTINDDDGAYKISASLILVILLFLVF